MLIAASSEHAGVKFNLFHQLEIETLVRTLQFNFIHNNSATQTKVN